MAIAHDVPALAGVGVRFAVLDAFVQHLAVPVRYLNRDLFRRGSDAFPQRPHVVDDPANRLVGFNTTFIVVSYPGYQDGGQVVGRGVFGAQRLDIELGRRNVP